MLRQTIKTDHVQTIDWVYDQIVDWASGGQIYSPKEQQLYPEEHQHIISFNYPFSFDGSITSQDGKYAFIYKKLGTKGLLLKEGKITREINRSYYHAETYEYPAAFLTFNNRTYLVHCPFEYRRLDFEDVETGEIITDVPGRNPEDVFHSRLSLSSDNRFLMVCGWVWQPYDVVELYDVVECFKNPLSLDKFSAFANFTSEINTASFIDNARVLVGSSNEPAINEDIPPPLPQKHIGIWNFATNELSPPAKVNGEFGNLFAINHRLAWDMYQFPKIINIQTGEIESKIEDINSGFQTSSIIHHVDEKTPQVRFNKQNSKIAIRTDSTTIEVLSPD